MRVVFVMFVLSGCQELVLSGVEPTVVVANGVVEVVGSGFSQDTEVRAENDKSGSHPLIILEQSSTRIRATVPGAVRGL